VFVYGWCLDSVLFVPGCAPLWDWRPVIEQVELFPGTDSAAGRIYEGGDGETALYAPLSR